MGNPPKGRRGVPASLLIAFAGAAIAIAACRTSGVLHSARSFQERDAALHWRLDDRRRELQQTLIAQYAGACRDLGGLQNVTVKPKGRGVVATIRCASSTIVAHRALPPAELRVIHDLLREAAGARARAR